jgi:ubiquinone/menaquinone biosynthesis C-methylase UbiE
MDRQRSYDSWHRERALTDVAAQQLIHPWHRSVAGVLRDVEGRVLEIGCGRGDFAVWLAKTFPNAEIVGVDFSSVAIDIARGKVEAGAKLQFEVADAHDLRFASGAFDYIISCECLEHVANPAKVADEIHRLLRPGGTFVITTENYFNGMILMWLKTWIGGSKFDSGSGVQPHENFFLFWRVKKLLENAGLKVQHTESSHFQWLMLPRTAPSKLATKDFVNPFFKRLFRPFGRHFTFSGVRPR